MKPIEVAQIHREICEREKCPHLDKLDYLDPCAACPEGHWGQYEGNCPEPKGLGDLVAAVAQPIARMIDRVAKTDIARCAPCARRKKRWNKFLTFRARPGK